MTLTTAEIEGMRRTTEEALPDTCTIFRRLRMPDGIGGYTYTWQSHLEDVPCRVGFPGGGESDVREASRVRLVDEETQMIWLPAKTDVEEQDRVLITDGKLFDVNAVLSRGNWELSLRLRVAETEWQDDEPGP